MILATHLVIGAAIGSQINDPIASFGINLALHYLLDMIPHWDYIEKVLRKDVPKFIVDFIAGVLILIPIYFIFQDNISLQSFIWGAVAGVLPDLVQGLYHLLGMRFLGVHQRFHHFFHNKKNQLFVTGFGVQIFLALAAIGIFLYD